jgi:ankyrin repeat protein
VPLGRTISENAQSKKDQKQLQEKLCAAAKAGDLMLVQELVELGAKPAEKTKKKQENCLVNAVQGGYTDVVKFLLSHGANPDACDPDSGDACFGIAFTHHAANLELLTILLKNGASTSDAYALGDRSVGYGYLFHFLPNLVDQNPEIDVAATTRLIADSVGLLDLYSRFNNMKEYTALQWACKKLTAATPESKERLKVLITAYIRMGARIDNRFGRAVSNVSTSDIFLSFCADEGVKKEDVMFLLDQGANPNSINTYDGMDMTALHLACLTGATKTIEVLLEAGAEIEAKDAKGQRPIHLAVNAANLEKLSLLLDHGADPDAITTSDGSTPLHLACFAANVPLSIIRRLVAANADLDIRDGNMLSPLHLACCEQGRREIVAFLLDETNLSIESRGGEVNATGLMLAAGNNNDAVLKYLIQKGADLDAADDTQNTALHHACQNASLDALRILVAKGANPNAVNVALETPLHTVLSEWEDKKEKDTRLKIISLLLASGTNPLARNCEYDTAKTLASKAKWKFSEAVEMLGTAEDYAAIKQDSGPSYMNQNAATSGYNVTQSAPAGYPTYTESISGNVSPSAQLPSYTAQFPSPATYTAQPSPPNLQQPSGCICAACTLAAEQSYGEPVPECYCDQCLSESTPVAPPPQFIGKFLGWDKYIADGEVLYTNPYTGESLYIKPTVEAAPRPATPPPVAPPPVASPPQSTGTSMEWERRVVDGEVLYFNPYTGETSYVKPSVKAAPRAATPPPATSSSALDFHSTYYPCNCSSCASLPVGWQCKVEYGQLYFLNWITSERKELRPTE